MKKDAHPIGNDKAGAPRTGATIVSGIARARLPSKVASVTAEVLARLLRGERLTSLKTVTESSTTRLAAVIGYLGAGCYGWTIDREDLAAGCRDGRIAWVREYWLCPEVIAEAHGSGGEAWCEVVLQARAQLRTKAADAYAAAAKANLHRSPGHHQGLGSLLDSEGPRA